MLVQVKVGAGRSSRDGFGAGMSGVRLVGVLGRDQAHVSAGNPTHRKGGGRRGGGREEPVPGAGGWLWGGERRGEGNRVRFQEIPEDTSRVGGVGAEASGAAPKGQGKTQRELILEAVETLKTLLGQGVGTQVVDLIQENIIPLPQVTLPGSPSELERAQHLAKLLEDELRLDKSIHVGWTGLAWLRLWWLRWRMTCRYCNRKSKVLLIKLTLTTGKMMHGGRGVRVEMML